MDEKALTGEPDDVFGRSREDISFVDSCCCHQQVPEKPVICFFWKFQRFILQKDASAADFYRFFGTLQFWRVHESVWSAKPLVSSTWKLSGGTMQNRAVEAFLCQQAETHCEFDASTTCCLLIWDPRSKNTKIKEQYLGFLLLLVLWGPSWVICYTANL